MPLPTQFKLKPAYPDALNDLAEVYLIQGKSAEAEQALRRAIEIDPRHADSYFDLAKLYEQRRDFASAIKTYQALLAVHPNHRDGLYNLALLYEAQGDSRAARETVRPTAQARSQACRWLVPRRADGGEEQRSRGSRLFL